MALALLSFLAWAVEKQLFEPYQFYMAFTGLTRLSRLRPRKGVIVVNRTLEDMAKEIYAISKGVSKGVVSIVIPPTKPAKPKWCQCNKCSAWHYLAK